MTINNKTTFSRDEVKKFRRNFLYISAVSLFYAAGLIFETHLELVSAKLPYLLFSVIYLLVGWDVLYKAGRNILSGRVFDEHFLMSIATLGAIAIDQLPEAAGVMIFYQIGEFLQGLSVKSSRNSIRALLKVRPDKANVRTGNGILTISPSEVKPGDQIIVRPGERIPLDGIVSEGTALLDTSVLTGEHIPREVKPGDNVLAGSINKDGMLTIDVTSPFEKSSIARMLELVETAASRKAPAEKFITKFAGYYTPVVVGIAVLVAVIPPLLFPSASFSVWLYRSLILLVISCPCALVISIPLGYFAGLGAASRKGILVKGSNFLDALNEIKTIIFDKTGTLTKGTFKVSQVVPRNGFSKDDLLAFAAAVESQSRHPIARSVLEAYGSRYIDHSLLDNYKEFAGMGIKATYKGHSIIAGSDRLLKAEGIAHNDNHLYDTVLYIAVDSHYAGYITISDELKEDTQSAIEQLRSLGIKNIYMLTGDSTDSAEKISNALKLDGYYAELLPEGKLKYLEKIMQQTKNRTAFAGDGINDAPVLARADIGISMGALGSDAAIETADIVIMTDHISKIAAAIRLARRTRKVVWQNIIFALGVKAFFITIGAFGAATMWEAVFADMGVALLAILNSSRLFRMEFKQ